MPERNALTNRTASLVSAIILTSAAVLSSDAAVPSFSVKRIGTLGGCCTTPTGINNNGWVVGDSRTADGRMYALLWIGDSAVDIGALPGDTESIANGVNDRGEIAGTSGVRYKDTAKVFIWQDGSMRRIVFPDPYAHQSLAINDSGNVIGATVLEGGCVSFAWIKDSLWTIAESIPAIWYYSCLSPRDINNRNQVAVAALTGNGSRGSLIWENGQTSLIDSGDYVAACINDRGQIAGFVGILDSLQSYRRHPCVWREEGVSRIDSFYLGYSAGGSKDINESGWVVGSLYTGTGYAFIYTWDADTLYNLNDLIPANSGWVLEDAVAINDSGWIVGTGTFEGQAEQGFLLTPASTSVAPGFGRASPRPAEVPFRIRAQSGSMQIRYRLAQDADVQVLMLDSRGRTVYSTSIGRRSRGDHTELVRAPRGLQGVHMVRIAAGLERWDEKVVFWGD